MEIMKRPWASPSKPYRAFDKHGNDTYYVSEPKKNPMGFWRPFGPDWVMVGRVDALYALKNWANSLQHITEVEKTTNERPRP